MESTVANIKDFIFHVAVLDGIFVRFSVRHHSVADGNVEEEVEQRIRVGIHVVEGVGIELVEKME
jgi:hypothetical protein